MKTHDFARRILLTAAATSCFLIPAPAATIYDNSVNDLVTRFSPGPLEIGDEVILAGTERFLTKFSFEYYGTNTASGGNPPFGGTVMAQVRFYLNDGTPYNTYPTPGTMFYNSGLFAVTSPTDRNIFVFDAGLDFPANGLFIPADSFTWSVQFSGMGPNDELGVDIYDPPAVGGNHTDYWEYNGGWRLLTNAVNMNFAAKMEGVVPEPSGIVVAVLGGAILLVAGCKLRRN